MEAPYTSLLAHSCSPSTRGPGCFAKALKVEGSAADTLEHQRLLAVGETGVAATPHSSLRLTWSPL